MEPDMMEPSEASFAKVPASIRVITTILYMTTLAIIAFYFTRRVQNVKSWKKVSATGYLILAIYLDSAIFIMSTATLSKSFSLDHSRHICDSAMVLCLMFWFTTKILTYFFFVEKAHIVGKPYTPRKEDKLYLLNVFGVMGPYVVIFILSFVYRFAHIDSKGRCVIGVEKTLIYTLMAAEFILQVYLTALFLAPLRKLQSVRNGTATGNSSLRVIALRTFVGACVTLVVTMANMSLLGILNGERGWMCLMLCNLDVLVSTSVLHWVTSVDKQGEMSTSATKSGTHLSSRGGRSLGSHFSTKRQPVENPDDLPDFDLQEDDDDIDSADIADQHGPVKEQNVSFTAVRIMINGKKDAILEQVFELGGDGTAEDEHLSHAKTKTQSSLEPRKPIPQLQAVSIEPFQRRPSLARQDSNGPPASALRRPSVQFPETSLDFQLASSKRQMSFLQMCSDAPVASTARRPSAVMFQVDDEGPHIPQPRRPSAVTFQTDDETAAVSQPRRPSAFQFDPTSWPLPRRASAVAFQLEEETPAVSTPRRPSEFQFDQSSWTAASRRPSALHMDLDPKSAAP